MAGRFIDGLCRLTCLFTRQCLEDQSRKKRPKHGACEAVLQDKPTGRAPHQYVPRKTVAMTEASEQANNASSANSMKVVLWSASVMPRVEAELS